MERKVVFLVTAVWKETEDKVGFLSVLTAQQTETKAEEEARYYAQSIDLNEGGFFVTNQMPLCRDVVNVAVRDRVEADQCVWCGGQTTNAWPLEEYDNNSSATATTTTTNSSSSGQWMRRCRECNTVTVRMPPEETPTRSSSSSNGGGNNNDTTGGE